MKIRFVKEYAWVNRNYANAGRYQWAREFLQNALEAGATRVEFGIEWEAVAKHGVYRRTIVDNGCAMSAEDLTRFFGGLGESGKSFGGLHENFGIGAKVSALPWNPDGVVVISYKGGLGAMIRMRLDRTTGDYELAEEEVEGVTKAVVDPDEIEWEDDEVDWGKVVPDWARANGTAVVLLGDEQKNQRDTILGDPEQGESDIKGITVYLNSRYWDLSDVDVRVHELRGEKRGSWPEGPDDRDNTRRPNVRRIRGAKYHVVTGAEKTEGKLHASGVVPVADGRVEIHWHLWEGLRPAIHSYAKKDGYIAVLYRGELFELTDHAATYRAFGIIPREVQRRLTLILAPQLFRPENSRWGIHPDDARQVLRFTDSDSKAGPVPILEWGHQFVDQIPEAIVEAVRAAQGTKEGSLESARYREHLMQKYGDRWRRKVIVKDRRRKGDRVVLGDETNDDVSVFVSDTKRTPVRRRKPRRRRKVRRNVNGQSTGVERTQAGFVPQYHWINDAVGDFDWHMASWTRKDLSGTPTVYLSRSSSLYEQFVKYFQDQYPPIHAERVREIVEDSLGQIAICKVAHANTLTEQGVSEETIDNDVLTSLTLTIALMGFMAEESVIGQRLGPLGKKRSAA